MGKASVENQNIILFPFPHFIFIENFFHALHSTPQPYTLTQSTSTTFPQIEAHPPANNTSIYTQLTAELLQHFSSPQLLCVENFSLFFFHLVHP